jgi:hypothetical protein
VGLKTQVLFWIEGTKNYSIALRDSRQPQELDKKLKFHNQNNRETQGIPS